MSPDASLVVSGLSALFIGTAALALLLPLLRNRQVLDVPNHRSSHTTPTVRGGGLGIVAALLAGLALGSVIHPLSGNAEAARGLSLRTRLEGRSRRDVEISCTGLRHGENLYEVLLSSLEQGASSEHPLITWVETPPLSPGEVLDADESERIAQQLRPQTNAWMRSYNLELEPSQLASEHLELRA